MNSHCYSSDLFLSWEWEWSSWDLFFFSSSSPCEIRQKWTPYSTVQHTHFSIYQCTEGGVCGFFIVLLCVCPVFAEFSFTCMVGLTNALEQDGFISGFMGFYLKMVRGSTCWRWFVFKKFMCKSLNSSCDVDVSSGWASSEYRLCCDDVVLGRRGSLLPLPHYHPPYVQRVRCGITTHNVFSIMSFMCSANPFDWPVDVLCTQEILS